jgi:hypothetical protein
LERLTKTSNLPKTAAQFYAEEQNGEAHPLDIIIRSLGSQKAKDILVCKIKDELIGPMAAQLKAPADQRASLITSLLLGIGISKEVMELPALQTERENICKMLEAAIQAIIDA